MSHIYTNEFYDYIDGESMQSARALLGSGLPWLKPQSVLDVGCGRGAWLQHWVAAGLADVIGIDGDFVDRERLHFPATGFVPADLSKPFDLSRKFDLVQSLEVAEHLPTASSEDFVNSLCAHGDMVLFSAAVPGQGGEFHINEQPLGFWRDLFAARSYRCFDCIRPRVGGMASIKPWYRYNSLFYVHETKVSTLPPEVREMEISAEEHVPDLAPLLWTMRKKVVSLMPRALVTVIAKANAWMQVSLRSASKAQN